MKLFVFLFLVAISIEAQTPVKLSEDQFNFTEGPLWDGEEFIYFTEIRKNKVFKYSVLTKTFSEAFSNTNRANGLAFTKNFDLLMCEGGKGRITKRDIKGNIIDVIVTNYKGKRFNRTNDMCIDKHGGVYFTDPTWEVLYQPDNGVYYKSALGELIKIDSFGEGKPNGIVISPDGKKLYVNDSYSTIIYRYDIDEKSGKVSNKVNFATLKKEGKEKETGADGMAVDVLGNLYVTAKKTVQIFSKNGKAINTINFPEKTTNCIFGKRDKKTLFVTSVKNLYSVELSVKGVSHPFDLP